MFPFSGSAEWVYLTFSKAHSLYVLSYACPYDILNSHFVVILLPTDAPTCLDKCNSNYNVSKSCYELCAISPILDIIMLLKRDDDYGTLLN